MENKQIHVSQQSAHLMAWIDYLCQPPFSSATFDAAAKLLIQQLLEAMQEGNSCIPASAEQTALLHHLVLDRSQQTQGIAPLFLRTSSCIYTATGSWSRRWPPRSPGSSHKPSRQ